MLDCVHVQTVNESIAKCAGVILSQPFHGQSVHAAIMLIVQVYMSSAVLSYTDMTYTLFV